LKRYRLAPDARRDVRRIWAYIAEDNETAANRAIEEFNRKFELLGRNPRAGRTRDEVRPGLRSFPAEEYLIFYRITTTGVRIMRVIRGRRDVQRLLN
jgi:toxin ParE1/3/4